MIIITSENSFFTEINQHIKVKNRLFSSHRESLVLRLEGANIGRGVMLYVAILLLVGLVI